MNKKIKYLETLLYYDVPQIFVVVDSIATRYLCILIEHSEEVFKSFAIPISDLRLELIKKGNFDIYDAFINPETDEYFLLAISENIEELFLEKVLYENISSDWYPKPGLYLNQLEKETTILEESVSKFRAIIHLSLNPPEAIGEAKIYSSRLGNALITFDSLLKQAYKKATSNLIENKLKTPENYETEVFAFAEGSFMVKLQSKNMADLFGFSTLSYGLEKIEELLLNSEDIDLTIGLMKKNKGHLISAFLKLFDFIIKNETAMTINWTTPEFQEARRTFISQEIAKNLYSKLSKIDEISSEEVTLIGKVLKADYINKNWSLKNNEDGKTYHGSVSEKYAVALSGITIESVTYKFICDEVLEDILSSGKEKHKLYLKHFEEIK